MLQRSTLVLLPTCDRQHVWQVLQLYRLRFASLPNNYPLLTSTHVFVPIAFKTLGSVNAEGAEFLSELGRRISSASEEQREADFLLQRLSMCACIVTIASHSDAHFRMIVKPGKRPDFLEKCLAPDMIFFFLAVHLYFWLKNIL